jgi:hypothetical protein
VSLAYIRDQLGHHSIKVTVDIYGHLTPEGNKEAVDGLDDATKNECRLDHVVGQTRIRKKAGTTRLELATSGVTEEITRFSDHLFFLYLFEIPKFYFARCAVLCIQV